MPQPSYYDILGVPRTASLEEIKRRYRELARQYHPDVSQNKTVSAKLFSEMTAAYKILSDPDSRAAHDAELVLRERQATSPPRQSPSRGGSRSPNPPPRPAAPTSSGNGSSRPAAASGDAARLLAEAQAAFVRGNFVSARALAEQSLRMNRRNAQAYEVLGDIFRLQGKSDEAINMYTMSLQINPRNPSLMHRLERLSNATTPTAERVFFNNSGESRTPPPFAGAAPRPRRPDNRPIGSLLTGILGYGSVFLIVMYVALFPGAVVPHGLGLPGPFAQWNSTILLSLALVGAILGATMTMTTAIGRLNETLLLSGGANNRPVFPISVLLIFISFISFYAAAVLHIIIGMLQESLGNSILRVFFAVIAVTLMLAAVYEPGHLPVAAFGANLVFESFLVGWFLGDFFRPDNYSAY